MTTSTQQGITRYPLTSEAYYVLVEKGFFEGERVELIEGEIIKMPSQLNLHAAAMKKMERALERVFDEQYWVRVQNSLDLSPYSVVDPDVALILGTPDSISKKNPTTALLVVEISESTLDHDQGRKAAVYARAGIADYWIVNLVDWQLEVYRNPAEDPTQAYGFGYASRTILKEADTVSPLAAPAAQISVARLFPRLGG